jgi:hypothetical protein
MKMAPFAGKEVCTLDTPLSVQAAVIAVLSRGLHEGSVLLAETTALLGCTPPMIVWRNTLIDLTREGTIERIVTYDDDGEKVIGVAYQLPKEPTIRGVSNELPSTAA